MIYLSGPMSGLPDNNYPAFDAEAERLRSLGYVVVNPAETSAGEDLPWTQYLRNDIKAMMDCTMLALLPGWQNSRGAHLEVQIAHRLDMPIVNAIDLCEVSA